MTRMMIGTLALTALVGCTSQDQVALEHRSALETNARGIGFDETGSVANVGMSNTTCDVDTSLGGIQADYDYTADAEVVVDGAELDTIGVVSVVLTPDTVHVTTPDVSPSQSSYAVDGVVDASLVREGFVAVDERGGVVWSGFDGSVQGAFDSGLSGLGASLVADPQSGTAFVANDEGVFAVGTEGEVFQVTDLADALVAWDAASDALYVAQAGSADVHAFEADGTLRWTRQVEGTVAAVTDMGAKAGVALSVDTGAGGSFVVLDGLSGERTAALATPSAASGLEVSGDGGVLAITLPTTVHFFDLSAD